MVRFYKSLSTLAQLLAWGLLATPAPPPSCLCLVEISKICVARADRTLQRVEARL